MLDLHIGDRVTFFGRAFYVRGFSPMGVTRPTIYLVDVQTGELIEIPIDDLAGRPHGVKDDTDEP